MTKLNITDTAKADIKETLSYIKDTLCNPKAASTMADLITEEFSLLLDNPKSGPKVNDQFLAEYGFRFLLIKNYKAYYLLSEEDDNITINIIRFLYARRDFESILSEEIE